MYSRLAQLNHGPGLELRRGGLGAKESLLHLRHKGAAEKLLRPWFLGLFLLQRHSLPAECKEQKHAGRHRGRHMEKGMDMQEAPV